VTINNNLLIQQLIEYMKLAKITIILMFKFMEDKCTFSTLSFMNDNLCNRLGHLDTIVYAILHKSFLLQKKENLYQKVIISWKDQKVQIDDSILKSCVHYFFLAQSFCFHDLDKHGDYVYFTIWILLTFGCGSGTSNCIKQSLIWN
jgi:hypothetical protein